jgi:glycolate oxidase
MKQYKSIDDTDIDFFYQLMAPDRVLRDAEHIARCASDQTEDLVFAADVVLQPISTAEVSAIMRYCNEQSICITPRGAGTGLSGGALPVYGGVVLDMARMNNILKIDTDNFQVTTQPGVITEVLQQAVIDQGLFYPVDPASRGSCFIGGNVAENSGGPRAVKYGVVKDYVLNLEIVLADGTIMQTGANTLKNATGYNLTQLIVGSEGTLAVVTKIVLRLLPYPAHKLLLLLPFLSARDACQAVNKILMAGFTPSALEFMERDALNCAIAYYESSAVKIPDNIQAHLLVEIDGQNRDVLMKEAEGIVALMESFETGDILLAESYEQQQELWRLRRIVGEAVKRGSIYKEEDTVVPRANLPQLLEEVKRIGNKYGFRSVCYGHAGDGNLHVNIIKDELSDDFWEYTLPEAISEIFVFVHSVNGTISGEHGIGYVQKRYMPLVFSDAQMTLMRSIKQVFDPNNILNPGKIF